MGGWLVRAACGCGRTFDAWRGKTFFVNVECCPDCGVRRDNMKIKTVRWVPAVKEGAWWSRRVVTPGYWQEMGATTQSETGSIPNSASEYGAKSD